MTMRVSASNPARVVTCPSCGEKFMPERKNGKSGRPPRADVDAAVKLLDAARSWREVYISAGLFGADQAPKRRALYEAVRQRRRRAKQKHRDKPAPIRTPNK